MKPALLLLLAVTLCAADAPPPSKEFVAGFEAGVRYGLITYLADTKEDDIPTITKHAKEQYYLIARGGWTTNKIYGNPVEETKAPPVKVYDSIEEAITGVSPYKPITQAHEMTQVVIGSGTGIIAFAAGCVAWLVCWDEIYDCLPWEDPWMVSYPDDEPLSPEERERERLPYD